MAELPPLRKGDKKNFETLQKAMRNGDVAILSSRRKSDGKQVALVCAINRPTGHFRGSPEAVVTPVPLAVMIEGNPYGDFEDPTQ